MATALPAIAALVSTAGTVYAANQAGKVPKDAGEMRRMLYKMIFENQPLAQKLLGMGGDAVEKNLEYLTKLTGGSREELDQFMGPQVAAQQARYQNIANAQQELGQRSGMEEGRYNPMKMAESFAQSENALTSSARAQLGQAGGQAFGMGQGLMNLGQQGGQGLLNLAMLQRNQDAAMGQNLGQGLGASLMGAYNMYQTNPNNSMLQTNQTIPGAFNSGLQGIQSSVAPSSPAPASPNQPPLPASSATYPTMQPVNTGGRDPGPSREAWAQMMGGGGGKVKSPWAGGGGGSPIYGDWTSGFLGIKP